MLNLNKLRKLKVNKMRIRNRNQKVGIDADYQVQQETPESTMKSSHIIDVTTKSDKNKKESYKKTIQNERPEESNESKKEKEQRDSFQEEEEEDDDDTSEELDLNIVTSNDDMLGNINSTSLKDNNTDEKDQNYYRLKQGIPWSTKFRAIVNIYKYTNRLSSPEDEYNWSRPGTLENERSKVCNKGKYQAESSKKKLPNNVIHGEFESLGESRLVASPKKKRKITMVNAVDTCPTIKVTKDSAFENSQSTHDNKLEKHIHDIIKETLDPLSKSLLSEVQKKQQEHADALLQLSDRVARLEASTGGGDLTKIKMDLSKLQKDVENQDPSRDSITVSLHPTIEDNIIRDGTNRETVEDIDDDVNDTNGVTTPSPHELQYATTPSPGVNTSPAIAISTPST